ncbi:MAG TPA: phosphoglucosamine mutase [Longimicrobiales bacterium]|nr:phosphoglucosamine mutase [Longimicrobiales bacterium]
MPGFELPPDLMVSVSGVRGRVGESLTPDVVARFACAFGSYLRERTDRPKVVLGRDSRTSGPLFARIVTGSLQAVGCDVIDVGLVPTPTVLFAIRHHQADGGIVVTASHNSVEWNALKLASHEGMFLDAEQALRMRAYVADKPMRWATWDTLGEASVDAEAATRHIDAVLSTPYIDVDALRARRFKVALELVRGAGAAVLPPLLERLGCEVFPLNDVPDGRFTRPPEPVAENLGELEALVRDSGADVGMATDPDADRLSLVSDEGRAVGEDYTLALAARLVLAHREGPVVTNLSSSRVIEDVALAAEVPFVRAAVGEINVARRMQELDAVIGGEGNGGVILPDVHHTRDAAVAAALVLQLMLEDGRALHEIVADSTPYAIVKDKLPRGESSDLSEVYRRLQSEFGAPDADLQDGLRLSWPDERRWLHFRASGTEPILRIIAEARDEAGAKAMVAQARAVMDSRP